MSAAPTLSNLPKSYVPAEHEAHIRARWEASRLFHALPAPPAGPDERAPFSILIPPPNVTAPLHLGHAFNNTIQDVLVRYSRLRGSNTLWMPGTDHAGIATQAVVERRLLQQGKRRRDFTRAAFVAKVQEWKDEYEATITEQLKAMGASCDWERQRFTMDPVCTAAVREAFFRLFRDGLVYRGKRLVNWDPFALTALADDEVEMREVNGHMWYLRYPLADAQGRGTQEFVIVATTRPETMLGDTAIAVNPRDSTRAKLIGRRVRLPIVDRLVEIVGDDYVVVPDPDSADPKARYASGFLKVTPAHDPNDWEIGIRHGLIVLNVLSPDAHISAEHGWSDALDDWRSSDVAPLLGLDREAARRAVVAWFEAHGLLADVRPYRHSVGHSYRSHVPIEPWLSDQWYVRVTDDRLVGEAQRALAPEQLEGSPPPRARGGRDAQDCGLHFHPARYARAYQAWHDNLRDWCISRQLWWGHQIPVWSCEVESDDAAAKSIEALRKMPAVASLIDAGDVAIAPSAGPPMQVHVCLRSDDGAATAALESAGFRQDEDVLDTWFSAALWPISTMGWPDPESFPETIGLLETFNPSSVLCTAREIITLWVSRMVMFNRYLHGGNLPFRDVYVHAMIQDGHGQKMSKSLGNGVDPRDCIHSHGADAMRFVMVQMATSTQDVRMPVEIVCPHCSHTFAPKEITSPLGFRVAAPVETCPSCRGLMVSGYGAASGVAAPGGAQPLARNTSSRFDLGRNFANKLWNAARFALSCLGPDVCGPDLDRERLSLIDRWIVSRLHRALHAVEDAVGDYQFSLYADAVYDFVWRELCDWYLEAIKPTVRDDPAQQQVLRTVLDATLRVLHPICPYVTEALWPHVQATGLAGLDGVELPPSEMVAGCAWPDVACGVHDEEAEATIARAQALTNAVRTLRGEHRVEPRRKIALHATARAMELVSAAQGVIETLAGLASVEPIGSGIGRAPAGAIPLSFEGEELFLSGLVDEVNQLGMVAERDRLERLVTEKKKALDGYAGRLSNAGYVAKAPAHVVAETRSRMAEVEADLAAARKALEALDERIASR